MKKIISLFLVLIILCLCGACFNSSWPNSFDFTTQEDFANIMKTEVDKYDENFDFHLYKWGDSEPTNLSILTTFKGLGRFPTVIFDGIYMDLTREVETYGEITITVICAIESLSDESKERWVDYIIDGYAFEFWDSTSSEKGIDYMAYYITDTYSVSFRQGVGDATSLKEKGYTVDTFLSYLPEILNGKYSLSL
ncbi:MAG: hypothetical protein IJY84_06725 [Clostridia bacterium]|nr:hypothetical protein [Clostridia bacterium]